MDTAIKKTRIDAWGADLPEEKLWEIYDLCRALPYPTAFSFSQYQAGAIFVSPQKAGSRQAGTASAAYDGVPDPGFHRLYLDPTAKDLKTLVPGKAVYVVVASGGDVTPDGHFATPVQMAYLMEGGQLVGRLPGLNISGNFYEMLGSDYLGAVHGDPQEDSMMCAMMMNVEKA